MTENRSQVALCARMLTHSPGLHISCPIISSLAVCNMAQTFSSANCKSLLKCARYHSFVCVANGGDWGAVRGWKSRPTEIALCATSLRPLEKEFQNIHRLTLKLTLHWRWLSSYYVAFTNASKRPILHVGLYYYIKNNFEIKISLRKKLAPPHQQILDPPLVIL